MCYHEYGDGLNACRRSREQQRRRANFPRKHRAEKHLSTIIILLTGKWNLFVHSTLLPRPIVGGGYIPKIAIYVALLLLCLADGINVPLNNI